ncbi:MAG: aminotransferase class III-fold pyridoxal phosphate-dependent enzyme [Armatimonadota bacterium]|nr:aminotransferase class III-fold pyridoxal phosphate-dependent enzyme [Armatimonadota bacterium]
MQESEIEAYGEEVVEKYRKYVNPAMVAILKFAGLALPEEDASGVFIRDVAGNEFLDCVGGYGAFSLGHLHPKVVEAVKKQLEKEALKSHYFMSAELADLCELMASVLPGDLQYSFICNSGTEAVEGALKAARIHTGRTGFIGTVNGFHGKTFGGLSVSGREIYKEAFHPLLPGCSLVPFGDADALAAAITPDTAAFIVEVIQGEGGVNVPDDDYFPKVREITAKNGTMLIIDEVRTGFGRTGAMFACQHYDIVPDVITMAKALGGGVMPVGAFSANADVWNSLFGKNPYLHSTTFGGNPLACAAAIAAIKTTIEEGLVERSRVLGQKLLSGLKEIQSRRGDMIVDVRGKGLLAGVEFALDDIAALAITGCARRNVLVAYSLNNPKVIRIEPPLIIEESLLDRALEAIDDTVAETAEMLAMV